MNLDTMNEIQKRGGRFLGVSLLAEIFDSPLPTEDEMGNEIASWEDLFRSSEWGEIFVPQTKTVFYCFDDDETEREVSSAEFVAWQILNATENFLYHLINKVEANDIASKIYEDESVPFPQEWNGKSLPEDWPFVDSESWLSEYEEDSLSEGLDVIRILKNDRPIEFSFMLADAVLDEDYGIVAEDWFEVDLSEGFDQKVNYDEWDVKIMCVAKGRMFPYLEADSYNLMMDDSRISNYFIRNHDEG